MEKISVCLATYNGGKYIKEQLDSILRQLSENDEVIISDDGSSDNTLSIVNEINDERIKIFLNKGEKGFTKNFENALNEAVGNIIFLSDQDDVWVDGKVNKMVLELNKYDFVISDATYVDENLNTTFGSHIKHQNMKQGLIRTILLPRYIGACMAFKKEVLEFALPFPKKSKYCVYDYWLPLIAELYFKFNIIEEELLLFRRHGENASNAGLKSPYSIMHRLKVRLYTVIHLIMRSTRILK
jgi:glycosyltransferase involved in cell wall biosynthesis